MNTDKKLYHSVLTIISLTNSYLLLTSIISSTMTLTKVYLL